MSGNKRFGVKQTIWLAQNGFVNFFNSPKVLQTFIFVLGETKFSSHIFPNCQWTNSPPPIIFPAALLYGMGLANLEAALCFSGSLWVRNDQMVHSINVWTLDFLSICQLGKTILHTEARTPQGWMQYKNLTRTKIPTKTTEIVLGDSQRIS